MKDDFGRPGVSTISMQAFKTGKHTSAVAAKGAAKQSKRRKRLTNKERMMTNTFMRVLRYENGDFDNSNPKDRAKLETLLTKFKRNLKGLQQPRIENEDDVTPEELEYVQRRFTEKREKRAYDMVRKDLRAEGLAQLQKEFDVFVREQENDG